MNIFTKSDKESMLTFKKRKLQYLGHVIKGDEYELLQLIIQGKNGLTGGRRNSSVCISRIKNTQSFDDGQIIEK